MRRFLIAVVLFTSVATANAQTVAPAPMPIGTPATLPAAQVVPTKPVVKEAKLFTAGGLHEIAGVKLLDESRIGAGSIPLIEWLPPTGTKLKDGTLLAGDIKYPANEALLDDLVIPACDLPAFKLSNTTKLIVAQGALQANMSKKVSLGGATFELGSSKAPPATAVATEVARLKEKVESMSGVKVGMTDEEMRALSALARKVQEFDDKFAELGDLKVLKANIERGAALAKKLENGVLVKDGYAYASFGQSAAFTNGVFNQSIISEGVTYWYDGRTDPKKPDQYVYKTKVLKISE